MRPKKIERRVSARNYMNMECSKDDFAAALRAHHASVDATKSQPREAAEVITRNN